MRTLEEQIKGKSTLEASIFLLAQLERHQDKAAAITRPTLMQLGKSSAGGGDPVADAFKAVVAAGFPDNQTAFYDALASQANARGMSRTELAYRLGDDPTEVAKFVGSGAPTSSYGPSAYLPGDSGSGIAVEDYRSLRANMSADPLTHQSLARQGAALRLGRGNAGSRESNAARLERLWDQREADRAARWGIAPRRNDPGTGPAVLQNERTYTITNETGAPSGPLLEDSYAVARRADYGGSVRQWGAVLSAHAERCGRPSWANSARLTLQGAYGLDLVLESAARTDAPPQPATAQLSRGGAGGDRAANGEALNRLYAERRDARIARYGGGASGPPMLHEYADKTVNG